MTAISTTDFPFLKDGSPYDDPPIYTAKYSHWIISHATPSMWCQDGETSEFFRPMLVVVFGVTTKDASSSPPQLICVYEAKKEDHLATKYAAALLLCYRRAQWGSGNDDEDANSQQQPFVPTTVSVASPCPVDVSLIRLMARNEQCEFDRVETFTDCSDDDMYRTVLPTQVVDYARRGMHALNRNVTLPPFYSLLSDEQCKALLSPETLDFVSGIKQRMKRARDIALDGDAVETSKLYEESPDFGLALSASTSRPYAVVTLHGRLVRLYDDFVDADHFLTHVGIHERSLPFHPHVPPTDGEITIDFDRVPKATHWHQGLPDEDIEKIEKLCIPNKDSLPVCLPHVYLRWKARTSGTHGGDDLDHPADLGCDPLTSIDMDALVANMTQLIHIVQQGKHEIEKHPLPTVPFDAPVCFWCTRKRSKMSACSACGVAHYCQREHQAMDWKSNHKKYCKVLQASKQKAIEKNNNSMTSLKSSWLEKVLRGDELMASELADRPIDLPTSADSWSSLTPLQQCLLSDVFTIYHWINSINGNRPVPNNVIEVHFVNVTSTLAYLLPEVMSVLVSMLLKRENNNNETKYRFLVSGSHLPEALHQRVFYYDETNTKMTLAPETGKLGDVWHGQDNKRAAVRCYRDSYHVFAERNKSNPPPTMLFSLNCGGKHSFWSASSRHVVSMCIHKIPMIFTESSFYDATVTMDTIVDIAKKDDANSAAKMNEVKGPVENEFGSPFCHEPSPLFRHMNAYTIAFLPK
eukprot:PhM_4_TR18688/c0_g1_i1/m.46256